jgi:protein-L-isoaspartate O-methyltransferase
MRDIQRLNMVRNQCKPAGVENEALLEAMMQVPREDFLENKYKNLAYSDGEWPSIDGFVMARPEMQAQLLEAVDIQPTDGIIILGSSYLAAITSHLTSKVISLGGHPILDNYKVEVVSCDLTEIKLQIEKLIQEGYTKVIIEKHLSEDVITELLSLQKITIFYPEGQGPNLPQNLIKYQESKQEMLGEILLFLT